MIREMNSTFNATDTFRGAGNSQYENHSLDGRNIAIACVVMLGIVLLVPIFVHITKCFCPDAEAETPTIPKKLSIEDRTKQLDDNLMIAIAEPHNSRMCASRENEIRHTEVERGRQQKGSAKIYPTTQESFRSDTLVTPECPICFDNFQVGEKLAWSSNPACSHLYHYKCIRRWLLRHKLCPYCRNTFLLVDVDGKEKAWELTETKGERWLCVQHGVQIQMEALTGKHAKDRVSNTVIVSKILNQENSRPGSFSQRRGNRSIASTGGFSSRQSACTVRAGDGAGTQPSGGSYQRQWSA